MGNQGFLDRHNGQIFQEGRSFSGNERDKLFINQSTGTGTGELSFVDFSDLSGADSPNDGRAVIAADFDDDGDLDLFVHEIQRERHALYRNNVRSHDSILSGKAAPPGFIKVRLVATQGQHEAIGATVIADVQGRRVAQVLSRGAGFVSCQVPELVFGLGAAKTCQVEVLWPGGARERFEDIDRNSRVRLVEGSGQAEILEPSRRDFPTPLPRGLRMALGSVVEPFSALDAEGQASTLSPRELADGGTLYLNLWATYCGPCVAEMPYLNGLHGQEGARVVMLSVDIAEAREKAAGLVADRAPALAAFFTPPEGNGSRTVQQVVDLERLPLPTTLVISPEGLLLEVIRGPLDAALNKR